MTDNREELAKELDQKDTEKLKRKVKALLAESGYTLEKLATELNERYYAKESRANLSGKLARGSLRHIEMLHILDVLGFDFEIKPR